MKIKYIASEKQHKDNIKKMEKAKEKHSYLPMHPFTMILQGSCGSGKSTILNTLISDFQDVKFFDLILFWNGCTDSNHHWLTYDTEKTTVEIFNVYNNSEFIDIMTDVEKLKSKREEEKKRPYNVLFVFDDCQMSEAFKNKFSKVGDLFTKYRHLNSSVVVCSQNFTLLPPNIRENNATHFVLVKANNRDLKKIAESHNGGQLSENEIIDLYHQAKKMDKYGFLVVDYKAKPEERFKYGFDKVIEI